MSVQLSSCLSMLQGCTSEGPALTTSDWEAFNRLASFSKILAWDSSDASANPDANLPEALSANPFEYWLALTLHSHSTSYWHKYQSTPDFSNILSRQPLLYRTSVLKLCHVGKICYWR